MKPRVFVSSTYYDLKHVRERIEKFIDNYGFESVLFERDKVTYEHDKSIDESAYNEVMLCHLMVLIVGGRYGAQATNLSVKDYQVKYENEYVSITRKEFETAIKKNIPIFIFIEKNVYSEYHTYKENQEYFDNNPTYKSPSSKKNMAFKFAHVDNINVFKFIDSIKSKPLKTFEKVEEIEGYLQNQLAGLFYLYLESLQKQKEVNKVLDTVTELNNVALRMNEMLNSVGKKILGNENEEYELVIRKQFEMIIDFFSNQIYDMVEAEEHENEFSDEQEFEVAKLIFDIILKTKIEIPDKIIRSERRKFIIETGVKLTEKLNSDLEEKNILLKFSKISAFRLNNIYTLKVKPFVRNIGDEQMLIKRLQDEIGYM